MSKDNHHFGIMIIFTLFYFYSLLGEEGIVKISIFTGINLVNTFVLQTGFNKDYGVNSHKIKHRYDKVNMSRKVLTSFLPSVVSWLFYWQSFAAESVPSSAQYQSLRRSRCPPPATSPSPNTYSTYRPSSYKFS